jgi:hypothetical protein
LIQIWYDIEKGERIQTVEDNSLDESEDERTEQGSSPGMPGTAMESDADDADVPGIGRIVSASVLSQPGYLPPPRQKRVSHKLKVAEDVLQRLYNFERLAGARPRMVTRRKRIERSIRIQEAAVEKLRDESRGSKKSASRRRGTDVTRYVKAAPSKEVKRKGAENRLGQSISRREKR